MLGTIPVLGTMLILNSIGYADGLYVEGLALMGLTNLGMTFNFVGKSYLWNRPLCDI